MGRPGIRRRKPPRHLRKLDGVRGEIGTEHSPWTVEGRIESIGMMGRGLRDASPSQNRYFGRLVLITVAALAVLVILVSAFPKIFG